MDQEKIGKLIKDLRIKSNLTQKQFADRYGVSYQAVSKWENGKNLPDTLLLKKICNDYNINLDDILEGTINNKKIDFKFILIIIFLLTLGTIVTLYTLKSKDNNQNFEFKTISSNCEDFKLNGSIAYNENKSVIYISNIEYCGKNENEIYKSIESILYETNNNIETKIGTCNHIKNTNVTLKDYLKDVSINVNNSNNQRLCTDYSNDNLYLQINAINKDNRTITFKIPLSVDDCK